MILLDPTQPGEEPCEHFDAEATPTMHITPLTAKNVTVYTVCGVPEYTFFYVRMVCGLYYLVFRSPATAQQFVAAGYPLIELGAVPDEVAECYRREMGVDPLSEAEIHGFVAELAGMATAPDES